MAVKFWTLPRQLCCRGMCKLLSRCDTIQWCSYTQTDFPSNLNYDRKIVSEMGLWPNADLFSTNKLKFLKKRHKSVLSKQRLQNGAILFMPQCDKLVAPRRERSGARGMVCKWQIRIITAKTPHEFISEEEGIYDVIQDTKPTAVWYNTEGIVVSHHDDVIKFSVSLAICEGNPPVIGGFPSQRPVTRSFDVFFDLRPNKRLSNQSRRRWCETPLRSLWRHCNGTCTM